MSNIVLRSDPYEAEYPTLVNEMLGLATNFNNMYATITKDGYCSIIYNKYIYIWSYSQEDASMNKATKLTLPSTGLQYSPSQVCIYKRESQKLPSVLAVSQEGTLRHWSAVGQTHRDQSLELNNEVAVSVLVFDEKRYVHRFILNTTTCTFFLVEVYHDDNQREQLIVRQLDFSSNVGMGRRMSLLLFGNAATDREQVLRTYVITGQSNYAEADLMVLFHHVIRVYSVTNSRLMVEMNIRDIIDSGLSLLGEQTISGMKQHLLDAVIYQDGILYVACIHKPVAENLEFYFGFIPTENIGHRRLSTIFVPLKLPEGKDICSPFHESSLPNVSIRLPTETECAVVFPEFVQLISNPTKEDEREVVVEEFKDYLLGSATLNGFCHLILKDMGICALRRLPALFDLSFWRRYRPLFNKHDFLGRDYERLEEAFTTFCQKDLAAASEKATELQRMSDDEFSNAVALFASTILNAAPPKDQRWAKGKTGVEPAEDEDRTVVILTVLRAKLQFYRMLYLFLCHYGLLRKTDVSLNKHGDRTARTVLVEFGEKLLCMLDTFQHICDEEAPMIKNTISQLAQRFTSQFDHPAHRQLTSYDHFFKEVSAFEEFIPELVKYESDELDQCGQDLSRRCRIVYEVGAALQIIALDVKRARCADWSTAPVAGAATWVNQPRSMKFFIQHLDRVFDVLSQLGAQSLNGNADPDEIIPAAEYTDILRNTVEVARLVLKERDDRTNSQIIAKFYEIEQPELALELALDFHDFGLLIRHAHTALTDEQRRTYLDQLKEQFKDEDFDLFLYDYYRQNGLVEFLLEERGDRLENFLANHDNINWIKSVENRKYGKARCQLKNLMLGAKTADAMATIAGLAKLAALCEGNEDPVELAQITETLKLLEHQEAIEPSVAKKVNPSNRPMNAREIIDANIQEHTAVGAIKALLVVASMISSPVATLPDGDAAALVRKIYASVLQLDNWSDIDAADEEQFKLKAVTTDLAALLSRVGQMEVQPEVKRALLPNPADLHGLVQLDHRTSGFLGAFISHTISSIRFCIDDSTEQPMEL